MDRNGKLKLPESWVWTSIGEIAQTSSGGTPSRSNHNYFGGNIPWLKSGELRDDIIYETEEFLTDEGLKNSGAKLFPAGTLCIALYGATVGKLGILGIDAATNQAVCGIFVPSGVEARYLFRYLQWQRPNIVKLSKGGAQLNISQRVVRGFGVPLAPLNEQRRIFQKIDEYFAHMAIAGEGLERIQSYLKNYVSVILKSASEGTLLPSEARLANEQNRSYESASLLLENILQERRTNWENEQIVKMRARGKDLEGDKWKSLYVQPEPPRTANLPRLPEGWIWTSVDQVGQVLLGRQRAPKYQQGRHLHPYLRVANVYENRINTSDVLRMNFEPEEYRIYRLETNDILLNEGQSHELIGRPAMFRGEMPGACFQNTLIRFRAYPGVSPSYALIVFRHYFHSGRFQKIAKWSTNIAHLGASRFARLEFPLPPLAEQERIANEVEKLLSLAETQAKLNDSLKSQLDKFREQIFQRAFTGKLLTQEASDQSGKLLLSVVRTNLLERQLRKPTVKRTEKPRRPSMNVRRSLYEVLSKARGRLAPEDLLRESGIPEDLIEEFYEELKREVVHKKRIIEERDLNGDDVFLRLRKKP